MSQERTLQVTYKDVTKIIVVPAGGDAGRVIAVKMNLTDDETRDILLEYEHPLFQGSWNHAESESELTSGCKVRILTKDDMMMNDTPPPPASPHPQSSTSMDNVITEEEGGIVLDLTNVPHTVITQPDTAVQQSSTTLATTSANANAAKKKKGLGKTFLINEDFFPKPLVDKLNAGGIMLKKDLTKILSALFDQITEVEDYPTPGEYGMVASALVRKWTGVREGLSLEAAKVHIFNSIFDPPSLRFSKIAATWPATS